MMGAIGNNVLKGPLYDGSYREPGSERSTI